MDETRVARRRRTTGQPPLRGVSTNTGALAASAWLANLELTPDGPRWFVEIVLAAGTTRFQLEVYAEEWGFVVERDGQRSWIRVTDVAFVHGGCDDFSLRARVPQLRDMSRLVRALERELRVRFERNAPAIRTSIANADAALRAWVAAL